MNGHRGVSGGRRRQAGEFGVSSTPLAVIIQCQNLMSPNCSCCQRSAMKLNACRPGAESECCGSCCIVLGVTHVSSPALDRGRFLNPAIQRLSPKCSRHFNQSGIKKSWHWVKKMKIPFQVSISLVFTRYSGSRI